MNRFDSEDRDRYQDLSTVESQRNDLASEEFPEGPYGSSQLSETLSKSSPWRLNQRSSKPFGYENHELHSGIGRDYPGEDDFANAAVPEVQDEP